MISRVLAFLSSHNPFARSSSRSTPRTPFSEVRGSPTSVSVPSAWVSFLVFGVVASRGPPVRSDWPGRPPSLSTLSHMPLSAPSHVATLVPLPPPCHSLDLRGLTAPSVVFLGVGEEGLSQVFSSWLSPSEYRSGRPIFRPAWSCGTCRPRFSSGLVRRSSASGSALAWFAPWFRFGWMIHAWIAS